MEAFDAYWKTKYDQEAKRPGATDYEISHWSEKGLQRYQEYFSLYSPFNNGHGKKVLDVGCGVGTFSRIILKEGNKVVGLDYSEDVLKIAKAKPENKNIQFQMGSAYDIPFESGAFDSVFSSGLLQCISDEKKALSEFSRVLRPGGMLAVMTLNSSSLTRFFQKEKLHWYSPYNIKEVLKEMGFVNIKIRGMYFLPRPLSFLETVVLKGKLYYLLNAIFPIFRIFSHSFYIEATKK